MELKATIAEMIEDLCPYVDVRTCTTLVTEGYLDSLALVALVADLEDAFDVEIPPVAVVPDAFDSIDAIRRLVRSLIKESEDA